MRRYFWLIPLIFMGLAMLACDGPSYNPIHVDAVQADPQVPGKAYIVVAGEDPYGKVNEGKIIRTVYETTDYGETWQPSQHAVFSKGIGQNTNDPSIPAKPPKFYWSDDNLYINLPTARGKALWTFPRGTFRFFFAPDNDSNAGAIYFHLDYYPDYDSSPAAPDVIYISLGTEGVLVGPNPETPGATPRAWKLSRNGIDFIRSLPLTITDPSVIFSIIALGLLVPPLSGLHLWMLAQVYRYAFQPGEKYEPYKLAGVVTGIITLLAAFAIYIWLTNANIDYYPIVGAMSIICVVAGVGTGIRISRQRGFSTLFTRRMAWASALVSLIVPAGVAAIWVFWPFIIAGVFGFGIYRRAIERHVEQQSATASRWALDRLAIVFLLTAIAISIPFVAVFYSALVSLFVIPLAVIFPLLVGSALYYTTRNRTGMIFFKKKNEDAPSVRLFQGGDWHRALIAHTMSLTIAAGALSIGVFLLQAQAHSWFQTLLVEPFKYYFR